MSTMLELTDVSKERIRELEALSRKAKDGEAGAKRVLRRAVKESAPEVIARCSNIARLPTHGGGHRSWPRPARKGGHSGAGTEDGA